MELTEKELEILLEAMGRYLDLVGHDQDLDDLFSRLIAERNLYP